MNNTISRLYMYLESRLWLKITLTFFFLSFREDIFFQILFVFHILCIGSLFQLNGFKAALGFGVSKTSTFVGTVGGAFGPPFMAKPGGGGGGQRVRCECRLQGREVR